MKLITLVNQVPDEPMPQTFTVRNDRIDGIFIDGKDQHYVIISGRAYPISGPSYEGAALQLEHMDDAMGVAMRPALHKLVEDTVNVS